MSRRKRVPVRAADTTEDDTLRLAHLLRKISRRGGANWARALVRRAFAFNGETVVLRQGKVVDE